jgi:hypothetical protein
MVNNEYYGRTCPPLGFEKVVKRAQTAVLMGVRIFVTNHENQSTRRHQIKCNHA